MTDDRRPKAEGRAAEPDRAVVQASPTRQTGRAAGFTRRLPSASGRRIASFRQLDAYGLARELQQLVFAMTMSFPRSETFSLTDQIRRSSRAVGANLAEAWHKRLYPSHFVSKLTDADAEQAETQHWLMTAAECGYTTSDTVTELLSRYQRLGQMLGHMINHPEHWCGSSR